MASSGNLDPGLVDALIEEPDLREPMREQLAEAKHPSEQQRAVKTLLERLEYADPQTPEGRAAESERNESARRWHEHQEHRAVRSRIGRTAALAKARVKDAAERLRDKERVREQRPVDGGWGRW